MRINIVGGSGLMGRVHRPVFERAGHDVVISGRTSIPSMEEAARTSDLTIVSVPINSTREIIQRVAPHTPALMDFTSVKVGPIEDMLSYTLSECEVGGLHPLYGSVENISERSVVYCPTKRSGPKCEAIVQSLENAGARVIKMKPEAHDYIVQGLAQNARVTLIMSYISLLLKTAERAGLGINEVYALSPPITKVILDLAARQVPQEEMYAAMRNNNPYQKVIDNLLLEEVQKGISGKSFGDGLRKAFGEELPKAQERAARIIDGK